MCKGVVDEAHDAVPDDGRAPEGARPQGPGYIAVDMGDKDPQLALPLPAAGPLCMLPGV